MTEQFQPGDRVRGFWDLATVLEVLDDGRVRVQFDAVDATGTRVDPYFCEPVVRLAETLTKVPQDTPMVDEQATGGGPPPRPPGLTDDQWSALLSGGGTIFRGRQYEDDDPVYEIRWPNGARTDLLKTTPLRPPATGGIVRFGDGPVFQFERSCWTDRPALSPPPDGMTLTMNFEAGFDVDLTPAMAGLVRSLTAGAPVDPRVDEEWEAWRCPGCGRSHAEVKTGHAWQVDGTGKATCNGLIRTQP